MKCPKCGGHLTDEPGNEFLVCDDCGEMFEPEAEVQAVANDQKENVEDKTQEFAKLGRVKIAVITVAILLTVCLAGVALYGINRYDKANTFKDSVSSTDFIKKADSNISSGTELTTEIMRKDYETYFMLRHEKERAFLVIGGAIVGAAFVWVAAIVSIEIAAARILRRTKNTKIIMSLGIPAILIVLGYTLFLSYMLLSSVTPKRATFDVVEMNYLGTRQEISRSFHDGHPTQRIHFKMSYEKDGKTVTESITDFEYYYVYPGSSGHYYVCSADGETFRLYDMDKYSYK